MFETSTPSTLRAGRIALILIVGIMSMLAIAAPVSGTDVAPTNTNDEHYWEHQYPGTECEKTEFNPAPASWTADDDYYRVIVKGGNDSNGGGDAVYPDVEEGDELFAPINPKNGKPFGVSHVIVCTAATITIVKDTNPDAGQDFSFTTSGTGLSNFSLDDDADATLSNTRSFTGLAVGTYTVTEGVDAGYTLSNLTCTTGGAGNTTTRTATISLTAGQTVTCTFVNTVVPPPPPPGTITIVKDTDPNAAQDFSFTTSGTGLSNFSLDDDADATLSNTRTFTGLVAGAYTVTEGVDSGYTLSNLNCTTGGVGNTATRTATITLTAGQTVTCTFVNTVVPPPPMPGTITIVKDTDPNAAQDFSFSTTGTGLSSFNLDDDADSTLSNTKTFTGLAAGSYTVTEGADAGYTLSDLDCTTGGAGNKSTRTATITLTAGQTVTCTFKNTLTPPTDNTGEIAIVKTMCDEIEQQGTCKGPDTSLNNYLVDFRIYSGGAASAPFVTSTVTLSENAEGQGNTGNGSQGRVLREGLAPGTYTVCEIPIAYLLSGGVRTNEVELDAFPRPEAGNGGSTGGSQTQLGENCVVVTVTNGRAEVKFLDLVAEVVQPLVPTLVIDKVADTETITITGSAGSFVATPSVVTWTLSYTLTNGPATNVVITDPVPAGFTFLDASNGGTLVGNTVTFNLGTVTTNGSVTFRTTVNPETIARSLVTNTATIDSTETAPDTGQDSVTVSQSGTLGGNPTPTQRPSAPAAPSAPVRSGTQGTTGVPNTATSADGGLTAAVLGALMLLSAGVFVSTTVANAGRRK